jgi:hypothetical protein
VPSYLGLGSRYATGQSDLTAPALLDNPYLPGTGWDVVFTPDMLSTNLTQFEVYQISIDGPIGSSVQMMVNARAWSRAAQGWANSWDPSQPLIMGQTDQIDFFWNFPFTAPPYDRFANIQPVVTLWLRHDAQISAVS